MQRIFNRVLWCWGLAFLLAMSLPSAGQAFFDGNAQGNAQGTAQGNGSADPAKAKKPGPEYRAGELLVKFKARTTKRAKGLIHSRIGSKKVKEFPRLKVQLVKLQKGVSVERGVALYKADPAVEYAEPNYIVHAAAVPNDTFFDKLWGMQNTGQTGGTPGADIQAPDAWNIATGSQDVVVAVIDTGIDYNHEDIFGNLWVNSQEIAGNGIDDDNNGYIDDVYGIDAYNHDSDPLDDHGHGTHCSGTIGADGDNGLGVAGVNWNVKVLGCKFLGSGGSGSTSGALECLDYVKALRDRGENVVATSNSWGCYGCYSQALADAIDAQRQSDILFVAAAGNANCDNDGALDLPKNYPSSYDLSNIIAVAATDHNDAKASFSCYGKSSVHIGAPGVDIASLRAAGTDMYGDGNHFLPSGDPAAQYYYASGTSMATPHVAGLVALLKSQDLTRDWVAIKNLVLAGGENIPALAGITITGKRINAYGSVTCADSTVFSPIKYPHGVEEYTVGTPTTLSALSINCELPVGPVTVTDLGGGTVQLLDDGLNGDSVAGDGIFTGTWTPSLATDELTFSSPAGTETVSVPPYADLVMTAISYSTNLETGQRVQVTSTVKNQGLATAQLYGVGIYLSTDAVITTDDTLLGGGDLYNLAPGEERVLWNNVVIPVGLATGEYYIGAIADYKNTVDEVLGEENNTIAGPVAMIYERYSDLVVTSVSGPTAASSLEQISVTATVKNQGAGGTWQNFLVGFYLSPDPTITTGDVLLGYDSLWALPSGYESSLAATVTIPQSVATGTYYIGAIADYNNYVLNESDRTNNSLAGNQIAVTQVFPDLVVTALSGSMNGGALTATATIKNQGGAVAGYTYAYLYLSTDPIITQDDVPLGSQYVGALAAGAQTTVPITKSIGNSIPVGTYYLGIIADRFDYVPESDETNNSLAGNQVTVSRDLIISAVSGTLNGNELTVTTTTQNLGANSGYSTTGIYFSTDNVITSADFYVGAQGVGYVDGGAQTTLTSTLVVPATIPNGTYYVGAIADFNHQTSENDETNNALAGNQVTHTQVLSDLTVTAVSGSVVNGNLSATATVRNQGVGPALIGFYTHFYLSTDNVITTSDISEIYMGGQYITSLAAGSETTVSIDTPIPQTVAPGTYYVGAITDVSNREPETDETNNSLAGNQVTIP